MFVNSRWALLLPSLVLCCLASMVVLSVSVGPMAISFADSIKALLVDWVNWQAPVSAQNAIVVSNIRLPRTLLCLSIGGILGLTGAVMQGVFRNPLADPGIIGVSSGAALGAGLGIVIFADLMVDLPDWLQLSTVSFFAFTFALAVCLLVYKLGTSSQGSSVVVMLLAGVAISAIAGAGMGMLTYIADDQSLRDLSLWQMGSMAGSNWISITISSITLVFLLVVFMSSAKALNILLLGDAEAVHLGIDIVRLKRRLIFCCAIGLGVAVSIAGMIGFIGLIIPHLVRLLVGPNHQRLLPLSAMLGALLLLLADILARTVMAPSEVPVGIITALLGSPFFIILLLQQRSKLGI